ncbi:MAG: hypothetical protein ABSE81_00425 [Candidatus Omnitrophota bacterium]|jgi:hypothetical protein
MKIDFKILILLLTVFGFTFRAYAGSNTKEITLIYTGETHGMIYPCNCPIEPDGGVARRATLVKQLRLEYPASLLLSTGGFFAAGPLDQYSQNAELDKQRTLVNLAAMEEMKYDAVAVGDDEFNFGKAFLSDNIAKSSLRFLSANIKMQKAAPYIIKETAGLKIGITAVTSPKAGQKTEGLEIFNPKEAVIQAVKELKAKGANIIILLSNLGEDEDTRLVQDVSGIDIVITGRALINSEELSLKKGDTLFLRTSWQGRKLNKAVLSIEDNKIADYKAEGIRLEKGIVDDPDILKILPRCFSDTNCRKESLIGVCRNAGSMNASCMFSEPKRIGLTVITSKACTTCKAESFVNYLKKLFPGLQTIYLYYPDPDSEAKDIIKKFNLDALPLYFLERAAENEKNFSIIKDLVELKGDNYLIKAQLAGVGYFINRDKTKGTLDVFLSLFENNTLAVLNALREFDPKVHFLVTYADGAFDALKGSMEVEEDLRAVCVQKYYPEKFWDYLVCRANNINSSWWDDCLGKRADINKIKTCARGPEGKKLLEENSKINKELRVMTGTAYLVDNVEIFASEGAPSKELLKKILKR